MAIRSTASRSSMSFSRTAPILTGRAAACSNTSAASAASCPQDVTPRARPGRHRCRLGIHVHASTQTNATSPSCARCRIGFCEYQLTAVDGVAEVASIGGFVSNTKSPSIPTSCAPTTFRSPTSPMAIKRSNGEVGGRSIEMAEKEFILRVRGYVQKLDDLRKVAVGVGDEWRADPARQVANVQFGPDMRRGIAELNGEGETVGGIVVVRYGANARQVIHDVKKRLDQAMKALPTDVSYSIAYDRTALIDRAVKTLEEKLIEECIVVALVCIAFLLHFRSALRRDHHSADRGADLIPRSCIARGSAPTSCRSAASPSPSAPWSTPSSS